MADNLKCEENFDEAKLADIAREKAEEEEKTRKDIELYHEIRAYVNLINLEPSLEQSKLKVISTAFACEIDDFFL